MPRTLAMPAPGCCWICRPGTAASHMFFRAPPNGIHDPPCGPVIIVTCWASAGMANAAATTSATTLATRMADMSPPALVPVALLAGTTARLLCCGGLWNGGGYRSSEPNYYHAGTGSSSTRFCARIDSAMLLLPRQARSVIPFRELPLAPTSTHGGGRRAAPIFPDRVPAACEK